MTAEEKRVSERTKEQRRRRPLVALRRGVDGHVHAGIAGA